MHQLGLLPLADLRLDAPQFQSLPGCGCGLAAGGANQLTNSGVKALVDAVCGRWLAGRFRPILQRADAGPTIAAGALWWPLSAPLYCPAPGPDPDPTPISLTLSLKLSLARTLTLQLHARVR